MLQTFLLRVKCLVSQFGTNLTIGSRVDNDTYLIGSAMVNTLKTASTSASSPLTSHMLNYLDPKIIGIVISFQY